jgi:iron complex transport system ATP-binding protein
MVEAKGVSFSFGKTGRVLNNITLEVGKGEFTGIAGPNGAGKTTLLKLLYGTFKPDSGSIRLNGRDLVSYRKKELAEVAAVVTQESHWDFDFTVTEYIMLGRYPFIGRWHTPGSVDRDIVNNAMRRVGIEHLRDRFITELSGGEKQRVMLGRALAQRPRILFLDEPGSHLDPGNRLDIFRAIREINEAEGVTILIVSHDINLVSVFCDRLYLVKNGRITGEGPPGEICRKEILEDLFGNGIEIGSDPWGNKYCFMNPNL